MTERNIDARASQGFSADAEELNQQFGDRTSTSTDGGDAAGRDVHKSQNINIFLPSGDFTSTQQLNALKQVLAEVGLHDGQTRVQAARDAVLPEDAELWSQGHEDTLSRLQQFDKLSEFLLYLIQDGQGSQAARERLKTELEAYRKVAGKDLSQPVDCPKPEPRVQKLNPYLMVVLDPSPGEGMLLVNAWLVPDDAETDFTKRFRPLDLTDEQKGTECELTEVPCIMGQLLKKSSALLRGQRCNKITIELFLPLEHLSADIDQWEVSSARKKLLSLRQKHPVIVRSYERLCFEDYLDECWNDWHDNWSRLKPRLAHVPNWELFETLDQMENCNWEDVRWRFQEHAQKIGFVIPCLPCEDAQEALFNTMIDASAPMAIWCRTSFPEDHRAELKQLIESGPLVDLPERLRAARERACVEGRSREEHFAYHLSLLWEDPNRLTPDVMIELQPPGER